MIKIMNSVKKKEEAPAPAPVPTKEEMLLTEIRDLLKEKKA
jgi:large conductance mechanosensitive channel